MRSRARAGSDAYSLAVAPWPLAGPGARNRHGAPGAGTEPAAYLARARRLLR